MISKLPQFSLPMDFPPRSIANPIISNVGILPHAAELQKAKELPVLELIIQVRDSSQTSHYTLMPRLKIPIFQVVKLSW